MKNLAGFATPTQGELSLCEVDGRIHSMNYEYANINTFTNATERHPRVQITRDMLHCLSTGDESRALFLPVNEPFYKQVATMWYEQGFTEALRFIASEEDRSLHMIVVSAKWAVKVVDALSRIHSVFQPFTKQDWKNLVTNFSQTRNWSISPIRCISWHPHCSKIAVAASDDSIRIYSNDSTLVPILKSKLQTSVSCIAWRPLSVSEIAVACETCILIWTVDPNSVVTRTSTANSIVLRRVNHHPIISLAWSPHGEHLVSASPGDSALLVWDVALDQTCTLKRAGTVGNTFLCWSQNGTSLLAASSSLVFRVWDCKTWNAERWNTVTGRIQSACWSPCGTTLLFVTSEETVLYYLCFQGGSSIFTNDADATPQIAMPIVDLSRIELENGDLIGGLVQTMEWDPVGRHLAILFKETNYVVIFMTSPKPMLQITPSCLVNGMPDEIPNTISFQKNFDEGSCLSIGWSSGRLQHFPLVYSDLRVPTSSIDSSDRNVYTLYKNYSIT